MAIEGRWLGTITIREDLESEQLSTIKGAIHDALRKVWPDVHVRGEANSSKRETEFIIYIPN